MFTSQHYEKIAEVLKEQKPKGYGYIQWRDITFAFHDMLMSLNENFKGEKFLEACDYDLRDEIV